MACWKGYVQKGMKMKNGRSVPNCVPVQKAYIGRAIRQPTETDTEFQIRHEYHTPFEGPQKGNTGLFIKDKSKKQLKEKKEEDKDEYYPTGEGKEYPGNEFMPIIKKKPMFVIEEIKSGGIIKGKPKLALRGWK